jgi:hypothetical protein
MKSLILNVALSGAVTPPAARQAQATGPRKPLPARRGAEHRPLRHYGGGARVRQLITEDDRWNVINYVRGFGQEFGGGT